MSRVVEQVQHGAERTASPLGEAVLRPATRSSTRLGETHVRNRRRHARHALADPVRPDGQRTVAALLGRAGFPVTTVTGNPCPLRRKS